MRFENGYLGTQCAAIDESTLACRIVPTDSLRDQPDKYSEHGFVIAPDGNWGF
ncbi:hypothetical protein [Mycolicibacterium brumae]|uniref:hypothetical protein n=1 Tax=Mycolicibacterium brumae TaxID=85968 RepID=UPI000A8079B5|nr:hypothetical protein [Mycolicibacterium brumae]MCV7193720.1 hypothetical protein [Mycolicibacterium brumae]RWA17421.1 hypothetical protein MBRU_07265 [Mycolicibacterium brumae DSM 44177]UWW09009.1 hypothetical protein L2Z93_002090 [Mycolicibacterium brumae]